MHARRPSTAFVSGWTVFEALYADPKLRLSAYLEADILRPHRVPACAQHQAPRSQCIESSAAQACQQPERYPLILFVVTGRGPQRAAYEAQLRRLDLRRVKSRTCHLGHPGFAHLPSRPSCTHVLRILCKHVET